MFWFFSTCFVILMLIIFVLLILTDESEPKRKTYEIRFEPSNNKYYIVYMNKTGNEERVRGRWGICTIYYDNLIDADFVLEKLNCVKDTSTQESKELK